MPSFSRYPNSAENLNQRVPDNHSKTRDEPNLRRPSLFGDSRGHNFSPIGHGRIAKTRDAQPHEFCRVATDDNDSDNKNNNDDDAEDNASETVVPVTSPNLIEARNANVSDEADLQHDFTLSTDSRDNFFSPPGFMLDSCKAPRVVAMAADEKPHSSGNEPTQHLPHGRELYDDISRRREHFMRHFRTIPKSERCKFFFFFLPCFSLWDSISYRRAHIKLFPFFCVCII